MTRKAEKRLSDLEKKVQPKEPDKIIVDWDPEPGPAKPGETVITWDDIEDEKENAKGN